LRPRVRAELNISSESAPSDHFATAVRGYSQMDFGEHRKGILGGWGIDKRDPTSDVRLIEFCLSLPTEMLVSPKGRRPLARAALADRLPPSVLESRGKGYQGSEWHIAMSKDQAAVTDLVSRISEDPIAANIIDVPRLIKTWQTWPDSGWESRSIISRYRNIFLQGLTAGHFILSSDKNN
jgi:asparagine synthase (glutamine-hydrolysing)